MNLKDRTKAITELCLKETSTNPYEIFKHIVSSDLVPIHGPEHHIIDGACILTAYFNAGGNIDLSAALEQIRTEGLKIPGAICGNWGVCGAVLSMGCALAIIDSTGPLSDDGSWGKHMEYTAKATEHIGKTFGPRCCKRDGMISIGYGIKYINENTAVHLESDGAECLYSEQNQQCIKEKCPYYKG